MNPNKKRGVENPLETQFSVWHLNLAYWMGRTLGDGSITLEAWQGHVKTVCGQHTALGDMTNEQAKGVLAASRIFTEVPMPAGTSHMTQRMN